MQANTFVLFWVATFVCVAAHSQSNVVRKVKPLNTKKAIKIIEDKFRYHSTEYHLIGGKQVVGHQMRSLYEYAMKRSGQQTLRYAGIRASPTGIYKEYWHTYIEFYVPRTEQTMQIICLDKYKQCNLIR